MKYLNEHGFYTDSNNEENNYLFMNQSDIKDFHRIEKNMKQLNNYCALCISKTQDKSNELKKELKNYKLEKKHPEIFIDPEGEHLLDNKSAEYWDYLEEFENEYIPQWEENLSFMAPSMSLVLLHIFLEKSLKDLCYTFSTSKNKNDRLVIKKKNESIIQSHLRYLIEECNFNFETNDAYIFNLQNKCRLIRNHFAHGNWEKVRLILENIDLIEAFAAVTVLFENIEKGMPSNHNAKYFYEED